MGASASVVDQGSPTSAHDRDASSSDSKKQHDWSPTKQAEAKQETHSLQEKLESYTFLRCTKSYCILNNFLVVCVVVQTTTMMMIGWQHTVWWLYYDYELVDESTVYAVKDVIRYVCIALGIPGNILSAIIWLRRHVVSKNSSAVYLAALAINDLLSLLLYIPIIGHITISTWLYSCRNFLIWTTMSLEPLLVLGFSVERLIAISCPLKVRLTSMWQNITDKSSNCFIERCISRRSKTAVRLYKIRYTFNLPYSPNNI